MVEYVEYGWREGGTGGCMGFQDVSKRLIAMYRLTELYPIRHMVTLCHTLYRHVSYPINEHVFALPCNLCVHMCSIPCLHRHLYAPLRSIGCSQFLSQVVVFILSAFFHEVSPHFLSLHILHHCVSFPPSLLQYLVSFPLQMIRPWAFVGMLSQVWTPFTK